MDSLIEIFHIDAKLLIAQIVNFAIVLAVLYFFVSKPIVKIMAERTKKIEDSMKNATEIEERLSQTKEEYEKMIKEAKVNATEIIEKASKFGEDKKSQIIESAKEEIKKTIEQEKEKMELQRSQTMKEMKKEISDIVMISLEKVIGSKMTKKEIEDSIKETIK